MAQSTAILGFLAVVMLLFIIVFVIMFINYKRLGRRWRREEQRKRTEPVVGTDRGPTSGPQQIHYHTTDDPMNQDIGGNLARIPRQEQDTNDNLHNRQPWRRHGRGNDREPFSVQNHAPSSQRQKPRTSEKGQAP